MELSEHQIIEEYAKQCKHCNRKNLLLYEFVWTCVSCGYNVIKRKRELSKRQRKNKNSSID